MNLLDGGTDRRGTMTIRVLIGTAYFESHRGGIEIVAGMLARELQRQRSSGYLVCGRCLAAARDRFRLRRITVHRRLERHGTQARVAAALAGTQGCRYHLARREGRRHRAVARQSLSDQRSRHAGRSLVPQTRRARPAHRRRALQQPAAAGNHGRRECTDRSADAGDCRSSRVHQRGCGRALRASAVQGCAAAHLQRRRY